MDIYQLLVYIRNKRFRIYWGLAVLGAFMLVLLLVQNNTSQPQLSTQPSNVLVLNDQTIKDAVLNNKVILVKFYVPWCVHCKRLAPAYEEAARILNSTNLVLAEINAQENTKAKTDWAIKGYPTMLLFNDGKFIEKYTGTRDSHSISEYMKLYI